MRENEVLIEIILFFLAFAESIVVASAFVPASVIFVAVGALEGARNTEVDDFHVAAVGQEHVGRFEVGVHDAIVMGELERRACGSVHAIVDGERIDVERRARERKEQEAK